ncbi:MAG TPA: N-succinylarginine dihydrolase [Tepidisphaeraceae bacterium]|jgi:succinylarginine dihydrolase|nr:N-succinylarginine dihydrolase [Tepidisphaeraceae bacterium]
MPSHEINFDALIGPTHNYAGLSAGNLASQQNRGAVSRPRDAALQGLAKMKQVAELGVPQAILPPQSRPDLATLRRLGFAGDDAAVVAAAAKTQPELLAACYSASSMWAANAATISPNGDCRDGICHITPANLASHFHRTLEVPQTAAVLKQIFPGPRFAHHPPLPAGSPIGDEGAANHTRLCRDYGGPGLELFVYGRRGLGGNRAEDGPALLKQEKFPARQTLEASQAIARLHGLNPRHTLFIQQNPQAIDAGVFHNDVIAVGNRDVLFCHEKAFVDQPAAIAAIRRAFAETCGGELRIIEVSERQVPIADSVKSYLFNSQLLTLPAGQTALLVPAECMETPSTRAFLAEQHFAEIHVADLRQSMRNGGGPACLRLRVVLTEEERAAIAPGVLWSPSLHDRLCQWVIRHYRETIAPDDLADPALVVESRFAMRELESILGLKTSSTM